MEKRVLISLLSSPSGIRQTETTEHWTKLPVEYLNNCTAKNWCWSKGWIVGLLSPLHSRWRLLIPASLFLLLLCQWIQIRSVCSHLTRRRWRTEVLHVDQQLILFRQSQVEEILQTRFSSFMQVSEVLSSFKGSFMTLGMFSVSSCVSTNDHSLDFMHSTFYFGRVWSNVIEPMLILTELHLFTSCSPRGVLRSERGHVCVQEQIWTLFHWTWP